jgi:hypothetical protein
VRGRGLTRRRAAAPLLGQLAAGAYRLEPMGAVDGARDAEVIDGYRHLELPP